MIIIHKPTKETGGLGDFLRSSISLFILSKKMNFKYYIDLSNNIYLEKCFEYNKFLYSENFISISIDKIFYTYDEFYNKINNLINTTNNYLIVTHAYGYIKKNEIYKYIDEYNNFILKPSKLLLENINFIMNKYNLSENNYISCHIRCGDSYLDNNLVDKDYRFEMNENIYSNINNFIEKNTNKNDIILIHSDNINFKNTFINLYPKYKFLDIKFKHIVKNTICYGENNINSYLSTISEFYIISKSKKIILPISYSGFSHWASVISKKELICNFNDNHINCII